MKIQKGPNFPDHVCRQLALKESGGDRAMTRPHHCLSPSLYC